MTIQFNPKLLSDPKAKGIGEWLRDPRARDYLEFLAFKAAEATAKAGNSSVEGSETELINAKDHATEARNLGNVINTLQTHASFDYKFEIAELKSTPPIKE